MTSRGIWCAPAMLHAVGSDGRIESVSAVWLETLGHAREAVVGRPWRDFIRFEGGQQENAAREAAGREGGAPERIPCKAVRADGTTLNALLSVRTRRNEPGGPPAGFVAHLEDMTRSSHFEQLFALSLDLLCIASMDGYLIEVSPSWSRLLGYPSAELSSRPFLGFVHPEDRKRTAREMKSLSEGRQTICFENRYRDRNGDYHWLSWTATPSPDEGRIYAIARDVTETKRAEAHRHEIEKRLAAVQKNESLSLLAGGIAHDFNNLLMGILGHAELAEEQSDVSPQVSSGLRRIKASAQRAADLCGQMLAYSGRGNFEVRDTDLSGLVREMTRLMDVSIGKTAGVRHRFADGLPAARLDVNQMRQVVMNLLTNASDAIGEAGGTITVTTGLERVEPGRADSVEGDELAAGDYVFFEVADTGRGMDEETRMRMFDPFFSTKFTGRGLGLAATLGIVRGHDGAVRVRSAPGEGTTIRVLLPALGHEVLVPAPRSFSMPVRGRGTVLLVDDEEIARDVAQEMLEISGYTVETASDGIEAVQVFEKEPGRFRLVLLDLTMPRLDGAGALVRLRRIDPDVRVILISGYSEQDVLQRLETTDLGFLQKPFDRHTLLAAVEDALRGAPAGVGKP